MTVAEQAFRPAFFGYMTPSDGPVVAGMEREEVTIGAAQPQYIPLRALISAPDQRVFTRWTLTPEQRKAIAAGADMLLEEFTFGQPFTPVRLMVTDGNLDNDWVRVCLLNQRAIGVRG